MSTAFLALRNATIDALLAVPAVAGGHVKPGRGTPLPQDWDAGVYVSVGRSEGELLTLAGADRRWETGILVQVLARAADVDADAEAALDPVLAEVYGRLHALTPPAGIQQVTLKPSIAWDVDEADTSVASATLVLAVSHVTTTAALE